VQTLTVLYDDSCGLCRRARAWLAEQPAYLPLQFVAAGSEEARRRFPDLDPAATLRQLTVVADSGEVYLDANAWVMCLWATRSHRQLAYRLSTPALAPHAARFVAWVSDNRRSLGSSRG
jgi:predicted DCC family thiol-disulfide oxidoreductase YuxK